MQGELRTDTVLREKKLLLCIIHYCEMLEPSTEYYKDDRVTGVPGPTRCRCSQDVL